MSDLRDVCSNSLSSVSSPSSISDSGGSVAVCHHTWKCCLFLACGAASQPWCLRSASAAPDTGMVGTPLMVPAR